MIWRSAIVAAYIALAIVVGVAYGFQGLAVLSYFYFWAGAWVAFLLVWGWAARAAGAWNVRRLDTAPPLREQSHSGPGDGELEAVEARDPRVVTRRRPVPAL